MTKITWRLRAGTPNYASECGRYVAVYVGTSPRGFASYRVFRAEWSSDARRKPANALSVGGLPALAYWERQEG